MKINKMLIAVTAMLAAVLSGCKDDETVGIDSSMPMPAEFTYDESSATSSSIMVFWDPRQAISAGATSFTVQLVKSLDGSADMYDATTSQTIQSSVTNNSVTTFDNLTKGRIFYVRIRANYPRSVFSEWTFAMADGKPARIMVGKGVVGDEVGETSTIDAKIEQISESTAIAKWSTCGYTNNDTDASYDYKLELFKDAACKDLHVSWNVTGGNISISKYGPAFIFSGLTPSTKYYFRATNTTDNVVSDVIEFTTAASQFKTLPATANEGEVILFQDFHEFLWGGDYLNKAGGYSNNGRSSATEIDAATGENPVSAEKFYICDASVEMGLFNTLGKAVPSTSLADWGQMSEPGNTKSPGIICARPGMMKMGASNYSAWLVTPELSCLTQPATIEVTFKIAPYDSDQAVVVELLDETTKSNSPIASNITAGVRTEVYRTSCGTGGWKTETVTVPNVTSTCRIAIGAGENGEGASQHRFHLDDIQLKVISYGELSAPDAPAKPTLTATDRTITATWEEVARAKTYTVEYKKTADSEWTVAAEKIAETTYTIEGLDFETQYDVRVKALIDDLASDYSELAQIKTLAEIKKLDAPKEVSIIPGLGWVWLNFAPVINATDYEVYAGDQKVESMITSEEGATTTSICAYGFNLNSTVTLKVKATAEGVESSDFSEEVSCTTKNIKQITENVGPTTLCFDWDDVAGGTGNTARAYYAELYKDQAMTEKVYGLYLYDGQASINGAYGSSSWMGLTGGKNNNPPTRVTFGQLEPATTYYFRVKTVVATMSYNNYDPTKTVTLKAPNGPSEFSPLFSATTEASRSAVANEVLYQGFDNLGLQADFINKAAGTTPYSGVKGATAITFPHTGEWVCYPFANSHLMSSWGMAAEGNYIDNNPTHNERTNYVGNANAGALEGWYFGTEVTPQQGYVKIGNSSNPGYYIGTPALDSPLLAAEGTPCTFSFKACPLKTAPSNTVTIAIEVYHAATQTFETIKEITLDDVVNGTSTDCTYDYKWTTYSADVTLAPGDNVAIVTRDKTRAAIDDILIVKK